MKTYARLYLGVIFPEDSGKVIWCTPTRRYACRGDVEDATELVPCKRDKSVVLPGYESKGEVKARAGEVVTWLKESRQQQQGPLEEQPTDADESTK